MDPIQYHHAMLVVATDLILMKPVRIKVFAGDLRNTSLLFLMLLTLFPSAFAGQGPLLAMRLRF